MFPLFTRSFPENATELEHVLNESLRRAFVVERDPVRVEGSSSPNVAAIQVTLDGASVREQLPRPTIVARKSTASALRVDQLSIRANSISVGPGSGNLTLDAHGVSLGRSEDANGEIVLTIESAANGALEISTERRAIESIIRAVAEKEAGKHGVKVEDIRLDLQTRGDRSVTAEVHLRARKMFLGASVRIAGQLDVDDELNAKISGLTCVGDGAIAAVACGVLRPQLQKLDGRLFSLLMLPLGDVRLHDLRIAVGDSITVRAEFGSV